MDIAGPGLYVYDDQEHIPIANVWRLMPLALYKEDS